MTLAHAHEDGTDALQLLASLLNISENKQGLITVLDLPILPEQGILTPESIMLAVSHLLPEQAIICDEAISSSFPYHQLTQSARPHDYLHITGGALGCMLSASIGAAIACPTRKIICLIGDGSAMYTIQALWTMAREKLDIIIVVYANGTYAILQEEMRRMGANNGNTEALSMLNIGNPSLNWVKMAESMGIEGIKVSTNQQFQEVFKAAVSRKGAILIEAVI